MASEPILTPPQPVLTAAPKFEPESLAGKEKANAEQSKLPESAGTIVEAIQAITEILSQSDLPSLSKDGPSIESSLLAFAASFQAAHHVESPSIPANTENSIPAPEIEAIVKVAPESTPEPGKEQETSVGCLEAIFNELISEDTVFKRSCN
jgi:hypothetical protein